MDVTLLPLGGGQDIGRSCILAKVGSASLLFDCGAHLRYKDDQRFPNFEAIAQPGRRLADHLNAVLITHVHVDHIASLPYLTEVLGYDGPIIMTHVTRALAPILLEDYQRTMNDRYGSSAPLHPGCRLSDTPVPQQVFQYSSAARLCSRATGGGNRGHGLPLQQEAVGQISSDCPALQMLSPPE